MAVWTLIPGCGIVAADSNPNNVQSGGSEDVSFRTLFLEDFRSWLSEHKGLIVGGYLSALILLAYPAAFIILWMQLAHHYGFGYWTALHAASLVPKIFVIGNVPSLIWISALVTNTAIMTWTMFGWGWKFYSHIFQPDDFSGFQGNKVTVAMRKVMFHSFRYSQLMIPFFYPLLFALVFVPSFPVSWSGLAVYLTYLFFCLLGAFFAAPLPNRGREDRSGRQIYVSIVMAFSWSMLAAVPLAGLQAPGLPTVELGSGDDKRKVSLLSNANGYWNVIDQDQTVTSIPDDEAGTVRVIQRAED